MSRSQLEELGKAEALVLSGLDGGFVDSLERASMTLGDCISRLAPAPRWAGLRENFEILVVALAVAMAFRTYFLQPFKIPTGSMQPTLMGITVEEGVKPGFWDQYPLKPFKWILTGKSYIEVRAKCSGKYELPSEGDPNLNRIDQAFYIVTDNRRILHTAPRGARVKCVEGQQVTVGDVLWFGMKMAGDHVFVDRVSWNFRQPRRGDIVVFSTDDIGIVSNPPVTPGTHYIKRLIGVPGETISIKKNRLVVNGHEETDPRIRAQSRYPNRFYPEYTPIGLGFLRSPGVTSSSPLLRDGDSISLGNDQFFALGDNTTSSLDGRFWGAIPEKNLVGPSFVVYWPFSERWGFSR